MPTTTTPRMPSARPALAGLALALGVGLGPAACGGPSSPAASSGSASPTTAPSPAASEVKLARVGGVAGFSDVLVVAPDGAVTGTTKNGAVSCTVPEATVQTLATAPAPTTGLNAGNDRIAASVEREGTTIDLGEAAGSDPLSTAAREVLDDVQLPQVQRTVCR
jgi:hypothetical protein